ncbi:MAG: nucleotidyltransferase family protein [Cyanobacteriota bacterium]|nr:nucleotidyltransferase family protein [Cyanobacteriota bacterium]
MERTAAIAILQNHRMQLAAMGARSLAVFGSVARDEARPDSDVDLLVDLEPPVTFDRYMDLKFFLENCLGRSVDLVTVRSLKPLLRDRVVKEAIYVS